MAALFTDQGARYGSHVTHLRLLTAGESHGRQLTAVLEGCPAGLDVSAVRIDEDLRRRQGGYGRGARQAIERDRVEIVGGVRYGRTTGAPIALVVANRDAGNWGDVLSVEPLGDAETAADAVRVPRPGHADLGGALLYDLHDIRDVIERASARETAARVAGGAVAKLLLGTLGCQVVSHVVAIGGERADSQALWLEDVARVEEDPLRCADPAASTRMRAAIDAAREAGDTLGGVIEVLAFAYPPGVGTYVQGDRRLESLLAAAVFTVPAIKGVEFGLGFAAASAPGSEVHDALAYDPALGYVRTSANAGGIEGGDLHRRHPDRARRDEAHRDAAESLGQRGDGLAQGDGLSLRALRRVRRPGRRRGARSGDRAGPRRRRSGTLRGSDGRGAADGGGRLPRPLSEPVNASAGAAAPQVPALALIGFMGAGKSAVGRLVADRLRIPFVDTDALIERRDGPIVQIFATRGERAFRTLERDVAVGALESALEAPCVVSLGGGAVLSGDVREALARVSLVVWLTAPADALWERVRTAAPGGRPLATDEQGFARLLAERNDLYRRVATAGVSNDGRRPLEAVAEEVVLLALGVTGAAAPARREADT